MSTSDIDTEIQAIEAIVKALAPLDSDAQERVLDYTLKRLDLRDPRASEPSMPQRPPIDLEAATSGPPSAVADIRSLREQKKPRSANEMAALVAHYLSEMAPEGERSDVVTTADIEKYFKQAGHQLPRVPTQTLKNAAAAGYFDSAGRGEYRLNPVGHNLVVHNLPRAEGSPPRVARRSKSRSSSKGKASARSKPTSGRRSTKKPSDS